MSGNSRYGLGGSYGSSSGSPSRNYAGSPPLRSTGASAAGGTWSPPKMSSPSMLSSLHSSSPDRYGAAATRQAETSSMRMPSPSLSSSYARQYSGSPGLSSAYSPQHHQQPQQTSPSSLALRDSLSSKAWGNVRFCGIGRLATKELVTSHNGYSTISTEMYTEVCQMLVDSKSALEGKRQSLTVDEDGRCTCCSKPCDAIKQTGALHFLPAPNGWIYIVITGHSYSQRLAYRMLDEVKRTFEDQIDLYSSHDTDRTIARRVMLWLPALCDRYDKLDTSSSMRGLAAQIDRILR